VYILSFLCPTSVELLMKEITVLRLLRRYPGVPCATIHFVCIFHLIHTYIYINRNEHISSSKIDSARQIEDSDIGQLRETIYRTTAGIVSLIIGLFMRPSCACFCSIDEWRHATKHRLMIDAPCELDDQSKREEVDFNL
jgi:hypothetical protein